MYNKIMEEEKKTHKKAYILPIVFILLGFILGWQIFSILNKDKKNPESAAKVEIEETEKVVEVVYRDMENDLYSSINDKEFVEFARTEIEKRCPFYEPDGVTYRTCLSDWQQELEKASLTEQVDEVRAYCSRFTEQYADERSLEGIELFLKCAIHKLQ